MPDDEGIPQAELARAREAARKADELRARYEAALIDRDVAIDALEVAGADAGVSQNRLARALGMAASTYRSTLPKERRKRRARTEKE